MAQRVLLAGAYNFCGAGLTPVCAPPPRRAGRRAAPRRPDLLGQELEKDRCVARRRPSRRQVPEGPHVGRSFHAILFFCFLCKFASTFRVGPLTQLCSCLLFWRPPRALPPAPAAEFFPDRTDVQCLHRWQKVLNPDLVKGPWTQEVRGKLCARISTVDPILPVLVLGGRGRPVLPTSHAPPQADHIFRPPMARGRRTTRS